MFFFSVTVDYICSELAVININILKSYQIQKFWGTANERLCMCFSLIGCRENKTNLQDVVRKSRAG